MNTFIIIFIVLYLLGVGWLTYEMINAPIHDHEEGTQTNQDNDTDTETD